MIRSFINRHQKLKLASRIIQFLITETLLLPVLLILRCLQSLLRQRSCETTFVFMKADLLGDALLVTPFFSKIKAKYPNSTVVVVASPRNKIIFEGNPFIDKIFTINFFKLPTGVYPKWRRAHLIIMTSFLLLMKLKKPIDYFIGTRGEDEEIFFGQLLNARNIVNFDYRWGIYNKKDIEFQKKWRQGRLTRRFSPNRFLTNEVKLEDPQYMFDELKKMAATLNLQLDNRCEIFCSAPEMSKVDQLLESSNSFGKKRIVVCLTASLSVRNIPLKSAGALLNSAINRYHDVVLLLIGESSRTQYFEELLKFHVSHPRIINYVGQLNFRELFYLTSKTEGVFTTDTSLTHIAFGLQKPAVIVFGPGNIKLWGPQTNFCKLITRNPPCSPCGDVCMFEENKCLTKMPVDDLIIAFDWLYKKIMEVANGV